MENLPDEACVICRRCGTRARFRGEELEALLIPNYRLRLLELERRNIELTREIEQEGRKGPMRDQQLLHFMHMERQRLLSEYSFLSYFSTFVDKW
jgi:hypothetical protein